jgi:predicted branched-subunit amino acid permease
MDYAFIGGLQFALSFVFSPLIIAFVRRAGTQVPMLVGIALQTAGFVTASYATEIWQLYLSQGVLIGVGLGFIFVPCGPVVSQWFEVCLLSRLDLRHYRVNGALEKDF